MSYLKKLLLNKRNFLCIENGFFIAVLLHGLVFLLSGISRKSVTSEEVIGGPKSMIPIELSFGQRSSGGSPKTKSVQISKSINTEVAASTGSSSSISTDAGSGSGIGSGTGNGAGNGTGTGSQYGFAESALNFVEPVYPIVALRRGIEGTLVVKIKISSDGVPVESTILKSSNHQMLDNAALKVIPSWRFQKRAGVDFYFVEKTFVFKLKNG